MSMVNDGKKLVAKCGLFCGACKMYLKGSCPGCSENKKATWCKVRSCCINNKFDTCAECGEHSDPSECRMFNNFISKIFALIFKSDRKACIMQVKEIGIEEHAKKMARQNFPSIKKCKSQK
jgi:hypothetical protein